MLSEFLNSINQTKENLMDKDPKVEKDYVPFVVNKCLSYFPDTIFYANRMNQVAHLDKKLQYDFYIHSISKRKRFSKWIKAEESKDLEVVKQVYGYSDRHAREVMDLLPMDKLTELVQKGGQKR
jgi:Bacteriophage clamp loader A subunit